MGCCTSRPRSSSAPTTTELRSIRKSQISPPVLIDALEEPDSPTSKYSDRYDPPTPPRPPTTPSKASKTPKSSPSRSPQPRKPPILTLQQPTPQKPKEHSKEEDKRRAEELRAEMREVGMLIGKLTHAIRAYSFLNTQLSTQTVADLNGVVSAIPRPPRGLLVRQDLQTLERDVANLYSDKRRAFNTGFGPALARLEGLWEAFLKLRTEEQRAMAQSLVRGCLLMSIFDLLSLLRAGCEELLSLDGAVSARICRDFDAVLKGLREEDCVKRGEDGVFRGVDEEKGQGASKRWRVLGIVEGKRKEELGGKVESVKGCRGGVSRAVLGIVEGLCED